MTRWRGFTVENDRMGGFIVEYDSGCGGFTVDDDMMGGFTIENDRMW